MGFSVFTDLITPTKYDIPDAPQLDINQEQQDTVSGNLASFKQAKALATRYNDFMGAELRRQLNESVPEFGALQKQMAQNLSAQLKGELTQSDLANEQRMSAANALGLGIAGSPAGAAYSAYNIGRSQAAIQQGAQAQAPAWLQTAASLTRAPVFDFSNVFMSPQQRSAMSWMNKTAAWNVQNMQNQMDVQPEPWERAAAGFGDSVMNVGGILGSRYAGATMASQGSGNSGGGGSSY